jgi:uncharacterized protein
LLATNLLAFTIETVATVKTMSRDDRKLLKTIGSPVKGDRFWGREQEVALFIADLDEGAHILLVAQRRMGKTSLMYEVSRQIQDRYLCLHVDLQSAQSAADAIAELSAETSQDQRLWTETKKIFGNILAALPVKVDSLQLAAIKMTLRTGLTSGDWREKGDRLLEVLASSDRPVAIFFDEVPILVNRLLKGSDFIITPERRQQVDEFMSWLRASSIKHQGQVRIVLTGSIGLEPILRQAGLSATINTFTPFDLSYWSIETARGCLEALALNYEVVFETGAIDRMLEKLGVLVPYHVQMFFDSLERQRKLSSVNAVSVALVDEIYQTKMLGVRGQSNLSHLEERLKLVLGTVLYPLALDLLTEAAVVGCLTPVAVNILGREAALELSEGGTTIEACREILMVLEHDGYLQQSDDGYSFVSKLIRDWWQARYGFNFVPAAQRQLP